MMANRSWDSYPATYRTEEMETLAEWIRRGCSGSVIGIAGGGKSNLLGFLSHRPEVLTSYWGNNKAPTVPVALIGLGLDLLPANDLATFYRLILRSFYENKTFLNVLCCRGEQDSAKLSTLQQQITDLYLETRASLDPFLCQSAVHTLLHHFHEQSVRVVFVMDRFEVFSEFATSQMLNALGQLRYKFKCILSYLIGMSRDIEYLADINQGLYHLLDTHICYVGAMNGADAGLLIAQEMHLLPKQPDEEEKKQLLRLTGGHPALLKAASHWWQTTSDEARKNNQWIDMLLLEPSIQSRLAEIWQGLSEEEQGALSEVQRLRNNAKSQAEDWKKLRESNTYVLQQLEAKGLCQREEIGWRIFSPLLSVYIGGSDQETQVQVWWDKKSGQFYQGQRIIEGLSPLTQNLLHFFVTNPHRRHTKTEVIMNVWAEEERKNGISDESLYRIIRELRKAIEPTSSNKPIYIVSWRATRPLEGGYQFFPEGQK